MTGQSGRDASPVLPAALLALAAGCAVAVFLWVDLTPRVENDFFFSTEDRELQTSEEIARRFPSREQLIFRLAGEARSPEYAGAVGELTESLAAVPGVDSVRSLTSGPESPADAFDSPFWRRLLIPESEEATHLVALVGDADPAAVVRDAEEAVAAFEESHPERGGTVQVSGVPYILEQIRRYLLRDLRAFSLAAALIFLLITALLFRDPWIVAGTLAACLAACSLTLALLPLLKIPIGLLTANLITIVFVLTLSHTVFLASNWRRLAAGGGAVREAVRITFAASFWCMATTLLGFTSLLLAAAKPIRELGICGAAGTVVAIAVAYAFFPPFLARAGDRRAIAASPPQGGDGSRPGARWNPAAVAGLCLLAGTGVLRLDTDPNLLSYFKAGTGLRDGLEVIDADGGSSPLSIVVGRTDGGKLDTDEAIGRLRALQTALEKEPNSGVILSVAPLLDEAKRVPLASFLSWKALLIFLESPSYDRVALSFMNEEHDQALFFLRMREGGRGEAREAILERLTTAVSQEGLEPLLVGGLYELQGKLARLVARSLATGLGGLLVLFLAIAAWVSRSLRATVAMVGCLILIPLFILGMMGYLGMPLDIISAPASNVAIALGVDSMIHLAMAARRARRGGAGGRAAWATAHGEMGRAVVSAALVVGAGFGIFALSSFPPTQRFGAAVVLGTLMAAAVALRVLPRLAGGRRGREPSAA